MEKGFEDLRNENKEKLNTIRNNELKLFDLDDEEEGINHMLFYSRRPLSEELKNSYYERLDEIAKEKQELQSVNNSTNKSDLTSTMSTARLMSLPSFQTKNPPATDSVLSNPDLVKHITKFNTNLGGKSSRYKKYNKRNHKSKLNKSLKISKNKTKKNKKYYRVK